MDEFVHWLESCDGGRKDIESSTQQRRQVLTIIRYVDPVHMVAICFGSKQCPE